MFRPLRPGYVLPDIDIIQHALFEAYRAEDCKKFLPFNDSLPTRSKAVEL